jgi:hypothetical protein
MPAGIGTVAVRRQLAPRMHRDDVLVGIDETAARRRRLPVRATRDGT